MLVAVAQSSSNASSVQVQIVDCLIGGNEATESGGGVAVLMPADMSLQGVCSTCARLATPTCPDSFFGYCPPSPKLCGYINSGSICSPSIKGHSIFVELQYVPWQPASHVLLSNVTIDGNAANCPSCVGGGLYVNNGLVEMRDVRITGGSSFFPGREILPRLSRGVFRGALGFLAPAPVTSHSPDQSNGALP